MLQHLIPVKYHRKLFELKQQILGLYFTKSYSQEGEDMVLRRCFEGKKSGYFVDIGAHHPFRFSNTYLFYKSGWRGINIDAMPGSMTPFLKHRPDDINLEVGVSGKPTDLEYYSFEEPAINGFDKELSEKRIKDGAKLLEKKTIHCFTLEALLDKHLPQGKAIDFMSIDVEGLDLDILKSNNWQKYRPEYVLVECLSLDMTQLLNEEVYTFMQKQNYYLFAKTYYTCFFRKYS